jgi:hypothetical protein
MRKVKELVKDSIFCAIICAFIMLFNFLTPADYVYISLLIVVFLGCYFQNKMIVRSILSSVVIFAISFLILNPLYVPVFILPSLIIGIISTLFLKSKMKFLYFVLILTVITFGINMVMEVLFADVIMNMGLLDYILLDDTFGMQDIILQFKEIFVIFYIVAVGLISFMEVVILHMVNKIYKKRIIPILGEKIDAEVCVNENK